MSKIRKHIGKQLIMNLIPNTKNFEISDEKIYKSIDLFAGIGGIRLGFEQTGRIKNIFSAEIDKYACQTYYANFAEEAQCDITEIDEKGLEDFDLLLAGFPCQAFSIAGKKAGFEDTRGTLFFDVARIIKEKQPKAFLLENVKGLIQHDKGKTFNTIMQVLQQDLGYKVHAKLLNAKDFNVPQKRERIYIVGFKDENNFTFPKPLKLKKCVQDIIETEKVSGKYYLSTVYLQTLIEHKKRHASKGNGFGYEVLPKNGISNTLLVGGMGRERNLIYDERLTDFTPVTNIKGEINREYIRRLTPREWGRLQGFPDSYNIPVSDAQAYKQFGNSVCVPVIHAIAKKIIEALDEQVIEFTDKVSA